MKLKLILLTIALSLCAAAQIMVGLPQYGVTLGGTPDNPTVVNNSKRPVLGWVISIRTQSHTSQPNYAMLLLDPRVEPIAAGGSMQSGPFLLRPGDALTEVHLDAVIFADGEFASPTNDPAFGEMAQRIADFQAVGKKNWNDIDGLAKVDLDSVKGGREYISAKNQMMAAQSLLDHQAARGQDAANVLAKRYSSLPNLRRNPQ